MNLYHKYSGNRGAKHHFSPLAVIQVEIWVADGTVHELLMDLRMGCRRIYRWTYLCTGGFAVNSESEWMDLVRSERLDLVRTWVGFVHGWIWSDLRALVDLYLGCRRRKTDLRGLPTKTRQETNLAMIEYNQNEEEHMELLDLVDGRRFGSGGESSRW